MRALSRDRLPGLLLPAVSVLAWVIVLWQWKAMTCAMCRGMSVACPMCMGLHRPWGVAVALFLGMWTAMMAAMMLPSVTPMVLLFRRVASGRSETGRRRSPSWIFTAGYLLAWALTGLAAFGAALLVQEGLHRFPVLGDHRHLVAGLVLILAGLYQLSPLKDGCLRHCRSPLDFLAESWRDGRWGALRMGTAHGLYCIGCCWGLMAVMFAVGLMNLTWMIGLTAVMAAEKIGSRGALVGRLAGVFLLAYGAATAAGLI